MRDIPTETKPGREYLDKPALAQRLGKSVRTIDEWMVRGFIPFLKLGQHRRSTVIFEWNDVCQTLDRRFRVGPRIGGLN